jgi:hypothetical protein
MRALSRDQEEEEGFPRDAFKAYHSREPGRSVDGNEGPTFHCGAVQQHLQQAQQQRPPAALSAAREMTT